MSFKSCLGSLVGAAIGIPVILWNGYVAFSMYTDAGRAFEAKKIVQDMLKDSKVDATVLNISNVQEVGGWDSIKKYIYPLLDPTQFNSLDHSGKLYISEGVFVDNTNKKTEKHNICIYQINTSVLSYEMYAFLCK